MYDYVRRLYDLPGRASSVRSRINPTVRSSARAVQTYSIHPLSYLQPVTLGSVVVCLSLLSCLYLFNVQARCSWHTRELSRLSV